MLSISVTSFDVGHMYAASKHTTSHVAVMLMLTTKLLTKFIAKYHIIRWIYVFLGVLHVHRHVIRFKVHESNKWS